jgi:uncharacterized membrane-anchored protein
MATTLAASPAFAKTFKEIFGRDSERPELKSTFDSMNFKQGAINLPEAGVTLNIPQSFYYLDSKDAAALLTKVWGNPPGTAGNTLGMVFSVKYPLDTGDAWGATVEYSADGYVSDADAESTDYNAVLKQLRDSIDQNNAERQKAGYEPIKLVGWASPPHYDKQTHALHWARDLLFGNDPNAPHTLNYQLRMLGREGVLELNFIAGINQLEEVKANIPAVISTVSYDSGKQYGDHMSGDKIAAYGLAGLILTGAGAKIAANAGLLAVALLFLKKGLFVVLVAFAAVGRYFKGLFARKPAPPKFGRPNDGPDGTA